MDYPADSPKVEVRGRGRRADTLRRWYFMSNEPCFFFSCIKQERFPLNGIFFKTSCAYTPAILVKVLKEYNVVKLFNSKVKT
jgi:hypothetical protein